MSVIRKTNPLLVNTGNSLPNCRPVLFSEVIGLFLANKVVVGLAEDVFFKSTEETLKPLVTGQVYTVFVFQPDKIGYGLDQGALK